jgi:hypothetical protein
MEGATLKAHKDVRPAVVTAVGSCGVRSYKGAFVRIADASNCTLQHSNTPSLRHSAALSGEKIWELRFVGQFRPGISQGNRAIEDQKAGPGLFV